ncbi:hypothetical protein [Bordetella genomosp. 10]|uniref:hypothetical protein n=1 Tax=Bordetella genomosp. 10 TaxID=1416804 RepID=UPI00211ABA14|nr:hypothetical protein [Bordetella genomosp. 10]
MAAVTGHLKIVPEREAREALAKDYAGTLADELMVGDAISFDALMDVCAVLEAELNKM